MNQKINLFKKNIKNKKKQVGIWNTLCSNIVADSLSGSDYDWVVIDMEHAPNNYQSVLSQLQAYQSSNITTIVRPIWNDSVFIKPILDMGPQGILFPMIQNKEQAEKAVSSVNYPPVGIRGVSLAHRANNYGRDKDYFKNYTENFSIILQVETKEALLNIKQIASVKGVDGIFFGPADLSADYGILGNTTDKNLWENILNCLKILQDLDKPAGTLVGDPDFAIQLLEKGFTFVACSSDQNILVKNADLQIKKIKSSLT